MQMRSLLILYTQPNIILSLTNKFHVAVRLFRNRSQMTSKCEKNEKVAHECNTIYVITQEILAF